MDLRTIGSLREMAKAYIEAGGKRSNAKDFFNVVNMPLLQRDDDEFVLDIIFIPELHLNLGIVNKAIAELNVLWDKLLTEWLKSNGIIQGYQKIGDLNGPGIQKFLDRLPRLKAALPVNLHHFIGNVQL